MGRTAKAARSECARMQRWILLVPSNEPRREAPGPPLTPRAPILTFPTVFSASCSAPPRQGAVRKPISRSRTAVLRHRRLEVGLCQFGLLADGPAPEAAGIVFLAQRHHG